MLQKEITPICYGKHWSPSEPECAGGRDPNYTDPDTGMHVRERCEFFSSCGARTQANKQQSLIPASNLLRQTPPAHQPDRTWTSTFRPSGYLTPVTSPPPRQVAAPAPQPGFVAPYAQQAYGYQQMMPVNYMMPVYLTVPEPRAETGTIWGVLGKEIARAALKSVGHTIASFFDHTPFSK